MSENEMLQVTDSPIVPAEFLSRVQGEGCGALVMFAGKVRGYSEGKRVLYLEHGTGDKDAVELLRDIAGEIRDRWDVKEVAFCFRTGQVAADEVTLVIAIAAVHRPEAFAACRYAIDRFKKSVVSKEVQKDG